MWIDGEILAFLLKAKDGSHTMVSAECGIMIAWNTGRVQYVIAAIDKGMLQEQVERGLMEFVL